jgi:hypothetical protein
MRRKVKPNVFQMLKESEVPFAVIGYIETMRIKGIDASGRNFYIAILRKDGKKVGTYKFKQSSVYRTTVLEYDLTIDDLDYFREHQEEFVKVLHNGEGRVYEPKKATASFKAEHRKYFNSIYA